MFRLLVLTSVVACAFGATIPKGLVPMLDGRIVGGESTTIEEFPHQISMRYYGRHRCGGTIYSDRVIISAAHCVQGASASALTIVAGATHLSKGGVSVKVEKIYYHEDYNPYTVSDDISLLILAEPLEFGDSIQPIPLQEQDVEVVTGTEALVSGWGALKEGGYLPDVLQYVSVNVIDHDACAKAYSSKNVITESMLCAGHKNGGRDSCQGDSGGPLISDGKLIGVVSWGYGCARPQYPGVYTKVSHLHDWVKSKLN